MHKKGLLSATFEESQKIVSKKILTEDGAQIGVLSSMSFWKRLSSLTLLLGFIISYGFGIYFPESLLGLTNGVDLLSASTVQMIAMVGQFMRTPLLLLTGVSTTLIILNILPKKNYAYQLFYGTITLVMMLVSIYMLMLPFLLGLTLGAFGWIGFGLQLMVCAYLWKSMVLSSIDQLKFQLYKGKSEGKDWGERILLFIKKYGGILLAVSIVNRWFFNVGEVVKTRPDLFSFLYGWFFILFAAFMIFTVGGVLKLFVIAFYFFKYQNGYRQYFKISDELWYGKWRAKLKSKFRK